MSKRKSRQISGGSNVVDESLKNPYMPIACPEHICSLSDHSRKKNCANNNWCLFGLGEFKEGIWAEKPVLIEKLGENLLEKQRKQSDLVTNGFVFMVPPIGLKNLGATCYLNVLMQCLFHNLLFRDIVMDMDVSINDSDANIAAEDDLTMKRIVGSFQSAFAHMQLYHNTAYDLLDFTDLLGLNKGEQQDPQEFNKLFLTKLEELNAPRYSSSSRRCMSSSTTTSSPQATSPTSIKQLITGEEQHSIECTVCGYKSVRTAALHEVELQVEGLSSIQESLQEYHAVEEMNGCNQYDCPECRTKCDALRKTEITQYPSVLFIQLLRYVYDRETYEKKKLKSKIIYPCELLLLEQEYQLVAVLHHKGNSAYDGHYVAEIYEWATNKWWLLDDTAVSAIPENDLPGVQPLSSIPPAVDEEDQSSQASSNDTVLPTTSKKKKSGKSGKPKKSGKGKNSNSQTGKKNDRHETAYMLCYVQKESIRTNVSKARTPCPRLIQEKVELNNVVFDDEVSQFAARYNALMAEIEERKALYGTIHERFTPSVVHSMVTSPYHLVPTHWLRQWIVGDYVLEPKSNALPLPSSDLLCDLTGEDSPQDVVIDVANCEDRKSASECTSVGVFCDSMRLSQLACSHDCLSISSVASMKVVSDDVYQILVESCHDGKKDEIAEWSSSLDNYCCGVCVDESSLCRDSLNQLKKVYRELIDRILIEEGVADSAKKVRKVNEESGIEDRGVDDDGWYSCPLASNSDAAMTTDTVCDGSKNTYFLSRSWVTQLKRHCESLHKPKKAVISKNGSSLKATASSSGASTVKTTRSGDSLCDLIDVNKKIGVVDAVEVVDLEGVGVGKPPLGRSAMSSSASCTKLKVPAISPNCDANASLLCVHGQLAPGYERKVRIVSQETWDMLRIHFPCSTMLVDNDGDGADTGSSVCTLCNKEHRLQGQVKLEQKEIRMLQGSDPRVKALCRRRQRHPSLLDLSNSCRNEEGLCQYVLVCRKWIEQWRDFISSPSLAAPDTLPPLVSLSKLICTHDQFLLPPWLQALPMRLYEYELQELSDIEQTTNNIQPDKSDLLDYADVELITKLQYDTFREFGYGCSMESVEIGIGQLVVQDNSTGVAASSDNVNTVPGLRAWRWSMEMHHCGVCDADVVKLRKDKNSMFVDVDFKVHLLGAADTVPDAAEGSVPAGVLGDVQAVPAPASVSGRSTRSRRAKSTWATCLSYFETVALLKMKLCETSPVDMTPSQQRVFLRGTELKNNQSTLMDMGLMAGDKIYIKLYSKEEEAAMGPCDDYNIETFAFQSHHEEGASKRKNESGFMGTFLATKVDPNAAMDI